MHVLRVRRALRYYAYFLPSTEVDENGKMIFELEANNFGGETKAKYFTDGYVEEKNEDSPPGFWQNLASGGRLQTEWEERQTAMRASGNNKAKGKK
jgi:hypothetical protein